MTRAQPAPRRIVVFTDVNGPVSATLLAETVRLARLSRRLEVVAVVVSDERAFAVARSRRILRFGRRLLTALVNDELPLSTIRERSLDAHNIERRLGIPVLVPEHGDPNEPSFVRRLGLALRPDVALSLYCLNVFRRPLLSLFEQCVNYHDSMLPAHRGLLATSFSVYDGDPVSGFSFHRMTDALDAGPILVQAGIPVAADEGIAAVKRRKLAAATAAMPDVLEAIAQVAPGRPQPPGGSYHSRRDAMAMLHIDDPSALPSTELERRLRAFGVVNLGLDGAAWPVTRLRHAGARDALAFVAADGLALAPARVGGLPTPLYRAAHFVERRARWADRAVVAPDAQRAD